jgi:2'-5' RNA ligase
MRLFVGIPLAAAVLGELSAICQRLQPQAHGLRWTEPETWHVTLQFLGNTEPEQHPCLVARLHELRLPAVPVQLEALGVFNHSGVFITTVRLTPELLQLQERVVAATALCGFVAETRPYQPHITLARSKGKQPQQELGKLQAGICPAPNFTRFVAQEFLLYGSFLGPTGSHYKIREHFSLDALQQNSAY